MLVTLKRDSGFICAWLKEMFRWTEILPQYFYFICGFGITFYLSGQPRAMILLPSFSAAQNRDEKAKHFEGETCSFILKDSVK